MDLSRRACPDHPCDRCRICRSGRCCQSDTLAQARAAIDSASTIIFDALAAAPPTPAVEERTRTVAWLQSPELLAPTVPAAPPETDADRAIREQWRRTRQRWSVERSATPSTNDPAHPHVTPSSVDHADDRDIVDAEVLEETWPDDPQPPALARAAQPAFGQRQADLLQSTFQQAHRRSQS